MYSISGFSTVFRAACCLCYCTAVRRLLALSYFGCCFPAHSCCTQVQPLKNGGLISLRRRLQPGSDPRSSRVTVRSCRNKQLMVLLQRMLLRIPRRLQWCVLAGDLPWIYAIYTSKACKRVYFVCVRVVAPR
jgi:hypothetical protein